MSEPLVSVVLPTFNRLEYLRAAVASVYAQTVSDWELVVADDGSDAPTREFLSELAHERRVRVLLLPHSGNPSRVRNAALELVRGKWIAFLDSDDVWSPHKLDKQVSALAASPCGWSYTGYSRIGPTGEALQFPVIAPFTPHSGAIFEQIVTFEAQIATASVMVERRLASRVGGFDEELAIFEHYDYWLRLCALSDVVLVDEPLVQLRLHDQHYSFRGVGVPLNRARLLDKAYKSCTAPGFRRTLRKTMATNACELASGYAETSALHAMHALLGSVGYAWRYGGWWSAAIRAMAKASLPSAVIAAYRQRRIS